MYEIWELRRELMKMSNLIRQPVSWMTYNGSTFLHVRLYCGTRESDLWKLLTVPLNCRFRTFPFWLGPASEELNNYCIVIPLNIISSQPKLACPEHKKLLIWIFINSCYKLYYAKSRKSTYFWIQYSMLFTMLFVSQKSIKIWQRYSTSKAESYFVQYLMSIDMWMYCLY